MSVSCPGSGERSVLTFDGTGDLRVPAFLWRWGGDGRCAPGLRRDLQGKISEQSKAVDNKDILCYETFFLACVCRFVLTSLSSFGEVFSGGQILIGSFLEEQSRTHSCFIPSLRQAQQPLFNCRVWLHSAHTSCRPVKHLLLLYSKREPTRSP